MTMAESWIEEKPAQVLRLFGCDLDNPIVMEFLELVYRIGIYRINHPYARTGAGACLRQQARAKLRYFLAYDQYLKRGVCRVLGAPEDVLARMGIAIQRRTVCALAWELSNYLV